MHCVYIFFFSFAMQPMWIMALSLLTCAQHIGQFALHHWLVGGWTETIHRRVSNIFCIFLNSNLGPHKLRTGASTTELSVRFVFTMIC